MVLIRSGFMVGAPAAAIKTERPNSPRTKVARCEDPTRLKGFKVCDDLILLSRNPSGTGRCRQPSLPGSRIAVIVLTQLNVPKTRQRGNCGHGTRRLSTMSLVETLSLHTAKRRHKQASIGVCGRFEEAIKMFVALSFRLGIKVFMRVWR
jgi:hypothetical protein